MSWHGPSAQGRRNRDEIACGGKLGVKAGIDGIEDFFLGIGGIHGVAFPVVWPSRRLLGRIRSYFAGSVQERDRQKYSIEIGTEAVLLYLTCFLHANQFPLCSKRSNVGPNHQKIQYK